MTDISKHIARLDSNERFLLGWLSKEDFSLYGECHGTALDRLVELGLAQIRSGPIGQSGFVNKRDSDMYRTVSLTDAGRAALTAGHKMEGA